MLTGDERYWVERAPLDERYWAERKAIDKRQRQVKEL